LSYLCCFWPGGCEVWGSSQFLGPVPLKISWMVNVDENRPSHALRNGLIRVNIGRSRQNQPGRAYKKQKRRKIGRNVLRVHIESEQELYYSAGSWLVHFQRWLNSPEHKAEHNSCRMRGTEPDLEAWSPTASALLRVRAAGKVHLIHLLLVFALISLVLHFVMGSRTA
jgi:hypothetical protein